MRKIAGVMIPEAAKQTVLGRLQGGVSGEPLFYVGCCTMPALTVIGCLVPVPTQVTPPLDGLVTRRGVPVAGVRVLLSSDTGTGCGHPRGEVRTDQNGRFQFDAQWSLHPPLARLISVLSDWIVK